MSEEKDSVERLLEDLDRAAEESRHAEGGGVWTAYAGDREPDVSTVTYSGDVLVDAARRLHALMPRDADGREIRVGDSLSATGGITEWAGRYDVCGYAVAPVVETAAGAKALQVAAAWRVVEPDSWERLAEDIAKDTTCDYFGMGSDDGCHGCPANHPGDCRESMAADIVRRAKALAGVE